MGSRQFDTQGVRQLLAQGWGVAQVAEKYGVSYQAVWHRVRLEKIPYVPDSGRRRRIVIPDLRELVTQGWNTGDIARKYKLSYKLVWAQIREQEIPYTPDKSGKRNGAWKGGRRPSGNYVYVWCPDHPFATKAGCVLESRLVMEVKLGRYLLPGEVVHHKMGYHNDPDNLVLYSSNGAHLADTLKGKIPKWTQAGRRRILEAVRQLGERRKKSSLAKSKKRASS